MPAVAAVGVRIKKQVYDSPEELTLVHLAKEGDENAFRTLRDAHHTRVFVTIKRMISDEDVSEWIANLALFKVWHKLSTFNEQSKFSTWVTRIAINEALQHIRSEEKRKREVSLDTLLSEGIPNPGANVGPLDPVSAHRWLSTRDLNLEGVADRQIIERAIDKVPQQFRQILHLRYWEVLSLDEIRVKLSADEPQPVSISAVKSRMLRGKSILIEQVERVKKFHENL